MVKAGFGVHVKGVAGNEDVGEEAGLEGKGMDLEAGEGEAKALKMQGGAHGGKRQREGRKWPF